MSDGLVDTGLPAGTIVSATSESLGAAGGRAVGEIEDPDKNGWRVARGKRSNVLRPEYN